MRPSGRRGFYARREPPMSAATVADRLAAVQERIGRAAARAGRDAREIRLVAVAKTAAAEDLRAAWAAGQRRFAHNRVQILMRDFAILPEAEWHAIGPLQGNKVRDALGCAAWVQTVAEPRTAARLARALADPSLRRPPAAAARLPVLLQANLHPEDGRAGCPLERLAELAAQLAAHGALQVRGLMTIAAPGASPAALRGGFARLRAAAEKLARAALLPSAPELSMGMSEDYEIAVEEGATLVRVGRAIFPPATRR